MKFDSFLSSPATTDAAFKTWWRWSLVLTTIILTFIIMTHLRAKQTYNTCATTCTACEKIATNSMTPRKSTGALAHEYTTINEQASVIRKHLDYKAHLALLAHDLIKTTHAPITLKSATLSPREGTIIFRCPHNCTVEKLTQKLATNNPEIAFHAARLEQQDNALLVTVTATLPHAILQ